MGRLVGGVSLSDATPETQAHADSAVVGTGAAASREDHKHAMPSVGILQSTIVSGTRSAASGTGAQAITGAGFLPTTIIVWATQETTGEDVGSWGFGDDAVVDENMAASQATMQFDTPAGGILINVDDGTANTMTAVLTTLDSDGCTITWTKAGTGMDMAFTILFLR